MSGFHEVNDGAGRSLSAKWTVADGFLMVEETSVRSGAASVSRFAIPISAIREALGLKEGD